MKLLKGKKRIVALAMAATVCAVACGAGTSNVEAKSKTGAMVIADKYYGSAQVIITSDRASASTSFGSNMVNTQVNATFRYKKVDGSIKAIYKTGSGTMTSSVSYTHDNQYSIESYHKGTVGNESRTRKLAEIL